jgi:hypothetical protein
MYFRQNGKVVENFDLGFLEYGKVGGGSCDAMRWLAIALLILAGFIGLWLMFDAAKKKAVSNTKNAYDLSRI